MQYYNPQELEEKWQTTWETTKLYRSQVDWNRPKHYALTMLPYPSGDLHIGHWYAMTPSDARARYMRMKGYNVLFPMGFDAFGLPAENAAVQRNIHPAIWTHANIERMRRQLQSMGAMFDWEREAVSCEPSYYHWTEWFFKKFYEHGLAYRREALVNWSESLQTVLANEQVIDGKDERNGQPVIQKMMEQWFFRITQYADELLNFEGLDWPEMIMAQQKNWIGRSEGAELAFATENGESITVFTTRPDTLWGATFMVLAPEHRLVERLVSAEQREAVAAYQAETARATEIERSSTTRAKTGVFTGGYAINPVNQERIPIWIADYVLSSYGHGAIMAVPAHDQRDFEFARQYQLEIRPIFQPEGVTLDGATMTEAYIGGGVMVNSGILDGTVVNTEKGRKNPAIDKIITHLEAIGVGKESIIYRLRDWLVSRQRYWGAPIPMIYKQDRSIVPVPDDQLPVLLPEDIDFLPSGRSPLTYEASFLNTVDEEGNPARRETDTMDTFMCSSWYQYRYLSPNESNAPFNAEEAAYWLPVDVYTGGAEHATMHLLYTRFFTKVMRDLGVFADSAELMKAHGRNPDQLFDEPMLLLRNQGQILGEERQGDIVAAWGEWDNGKLFANRILVIPTSADAPDDVTVVGELMRRTENLLQLNTGSADWQVVELLPNAQVTIPRIEGENNAQQLKHHLEIQRMSKSKGNVVNPDELVAKYGSDTVRSYLMFAFDWTKGGPWDSRGIVGTQRFIRDVWRIGTESYSAENESETANRALRRKIHQTIERVTRHFENFSFNTAIAALMELRNTLLETMQQKNVSQAVWGEALDHLLLLLAPIAPHITEELWAQRGNGYSIHQQAWPIYDPEVAKEETISLAVQVNGKLRDKIDFSADATQEQIEQIVLESPIVQRFLEGKTPKRILIVPGRLVNIVV